MSNIVIVDLGTGNLRSVSRALQHADESRAHSVHISAQPQAIRAADYLVLPGQGAIGAWVSRLTQTPALKQAVLDRLGDGPALGICVGLQALYEQSEENGGMPGLGVFAGTVRRFADARRKIPHMGWNRVRQVRDHPLWHGIIDAQHFYFAHSYYPEPHHRDEIVGECEYGATFAAACARDNLFAVQFHPEKSQRAGLQLLRNFLRWNGA